MTSYLVCVPYYSLPEFPSYCRVVSNHNVVVRDILLCNPLNFHVRGGVQFDPHLETLEYINCEPSVRRSIAYKLGQNDSIRILYRTRFLRLNGSSDYLVAGYYEVGGISNEECRDAPVIKASRAKFLSLPNCVNITRLLNKTNAYRSCFSTENERWKSYLRRWGAYIDSQRNMMRDYVREVKRLKELYGRNEFQDGRVAYGDCQDCQATREICPLLRRRTKFRSLPRFPRHFT